LQYIVSVEHFESANLYGNEKFQVEYFATVNTYAMCINGEYFSNHCRVLKMIGR